MQIIKPNGEGEVAPWGLSDPHMQVNGYDRTISYAVSERQAQAQLINKILIAQWCMCDTPIHTLIRRR
jgi:hypothetical protein